MVGRQTTFFKVIFHFLNVAPLLESLLLMLVFFFVRGLLALRSPNTDELPTVHVSLERI